MNADIYIRQGDSHAICEDYGETRIGENWGAVVVCDGCSSSPRTDIGARLLARAALDRINLLDDHEAFAESTISLAGEGARFLNLPDTCLDSTLIIVRAGADTCRAVVFGDGAVILGYADNRVVLHAVDYPLNAPEYLSYRLDPGRRAAYEALVDGDVDRALVHQTVLCGGTITASTPMPLPTPLVLDVALGGDDPVRWIAAVTDGVKSFSRSVRGVAGKGREAVDEVDVARDLLDFVNVNGRFVERQMRWFLAECEKRGWKHADDLAVAAISFEPALDA